jgi:hypothetical protein
MMSTTRSGRIYNECNSKDASALLSPFAKRSQRQHEASTSDAFVTPDSKMKGNITHEQECCDIDFSNTVISNPFRSEERQKESKLEFLPVVSPFQYSISDDTESEVSANFGGWITDEPPKSLLEEVYSSEPALTAGKTLPLLPGIARNFYGGIRDNLPPSQICRPSEPRSSSLPATPVVLATPTMSAISATSTFSAASPPTPVTPLTKEQLQRMETNRQVALAKLRAKQGQEAARTKEQVAAGAFSLCL